MKPNSIYSILCSFICLFSLMGCGEEEGGAPVVSGEIMTVSINKELADNESRLLLADDTVPGVVLTFSEPIYLNSVQKGIRLEAFVRGATEPRLLAPEVVCAEGEENILHLKIPVGKFAPHTLYRLHVTTDLLSTTGSTLKQEVGGVFYVGGKECFDFGSTEMSTHVKGAIVVISDIHMGDQRSLDKGYGWFKDNRQRLADFLDYLTDNSAFLDKLVIAGDFMDEWVAPMNVAPFADESGNLISQQEFVGKIVAANQAIADKLKELHNRNVKIVYVPGNHDMLVRAEDLDRYFGKGVITYASEARGVGRYEPNEDIVIEHGHRYDYFNSPDPFSNRGIDQVDDKSILPPGFFVSKIASSSELEAISKKRSEAGLPSLRSSNGTDDANWMFLSLAWPLVLSQKPVTESISGKYIKTGIDGLTRDYLIADLSNWHLSTNPEKSTKPTLYSISNKADVWAQRLKANGVLNTEVITFEMGLLSGAMSSVFKRLAENQYIEGQTTPKRIIVFGHTHEPALTTIGNSVYANSGTWVDKRWAPGLSNPTFVVIQEYVDAKNKGGKEVSLFGFGSKDKVLKIGKTYWLGY